MDNKHFRRYAHEMVDWMADYLETIESRPVRSPLSPGEVLQQLPDTPPEQAETQQQLMQDFESIILPGITHWQHPAFFAYFPANSSYPSVLAEMLTATLGAQCMIWQTSPAAAELEERMMQWLGRMLQLPEGFYGVIQDTASAATLCAILSARERASGFTVNHRGLSGEQRYTIYCSGQTHSSIDKAVRIAGLGSNQLRKIAVDRDYALRPEALQQAISADRQAGYQPLCVIATCGTTSSAAMDPIPAIGEICRSEGLWLHIDAAYAGTAAILPEKRTILNGIELADSFVFNPHKWMFTNFDCSAYYVRDREALIRTFEIMPEYLKTREDQRVNNYRDWGVALGRRFRALKLWFVIRSFGVEGIRARLREHLRLAQLFCSWLEAREDVHILAPVTLNTICFHFRPSGLSAAQIERFNTRLLEELNDSGKMYLTHTRLNDVYTLRLVIGQTYVEERHIRAAWQQMQECADRLLPVSRQRQ